MKTKIKNRRTSFFTEKGFRVQRDQIKKVSKLLGLRDREIKEQLVHTTYEELKEMAVLYNKVKIRMGLNHPEMKTFLIERKPYRLSEIADALGVTIKDK